MNIRRIHKSFVNSYTPLIITLLGFIVLRMFWIDKDNLLELLGSMFAQIGVAIFLLFLTQKHVIIRERTLLPSFCYLLLIGTNHLFINNLQGSVSALLVVSCLCFLFNIYQTPFPQRNALNVSLLLTFGSLYWTPLIYFFPLFWWGMSWFKNLNIKTFLASLMGIAIVCLFLLARSLYCENWTVFAKILFDLSTLGEFQLASLFIRNMTEIIFVGVLFILSVINAFRSDVSEKAQARTMLGYLSLLTVVLFIVFLFQNQWMKEWLLILYIPVSLLIAHYFTLTQNRVVMWLFLVTIVFFLFMFGWKWLAL